MTQHLTEVGKERLRTATRPLQPLVLDKTGAVRFQENAIVVWLLDHGGFDMNLLATMNFSDADREQFAQLIGYSLSGFGELSYVSDESYGEAVIVGIKLLDEKT